VRCVACRICGLFSACSFARRACEASGGWAGGTSLVGDFTLGIFGAHIGATTHHGTTHLRTSTRQPPASHPATSNQPRADELITRHSSPDRVESLVTGLRLHNARGVCDWHCQLCDSPTTGSSNSNLEHFRPQGQMQTTYTSWVTPIRAARSVGGR
jgi:hypothetical protein